MASRDTTLHQLIKNQEKAKRQLSAFFDELEFMFTNISAVRVLPDGKRESFYGDVFTLRSGIDTLYWLHMSERKSRWYALVKFTDGQYAYIRCTYQDFWPLENSVRFYVSCSPTELIEHAMKKHAYKMYRKRSTT